MKTAILAGSTGLIGKHLLDLLLGSDRYSKVIALARRDLHLQHPKLQQIITDLPRLGSDIGSIKADDVFCCLGTTMAVAGSKEKFYEVDFTYPVELAKLTHANGAKQYLIASALGADKTSSIYYNKVKGEVEETVSRVPFESIHVFRPSLLLGDRKESRPGEMAAKVVFGLIGFLIPEKFKGIHGSQVAKAMLHFASLDQKGKYIHESKDLQRI